MLNIPNSSCHFPCKTIEPFSVAGHLPREHYNLPLKIVLGNKYLFCVDLEGENILNNQVPCFVFDYSKLIFGVY